MAFLQDKKILITGLLSNRSIAYGIAKAAHREGAQLAFTYQGTALNQWHIYVQREQVEWLGIPPEQPEPDPRIAILCFRAVQ